MLSNSRLRQKHYLPRDEAKPNQDVWASIDFVKLREIWVGVGSVVYDVLDFCKMRSHVSWGNQLVRSAIEGMAYLHCRILGIT